MEDEIYEENNKNNKNNEKNNGDIYENIGVIRGNEDFDKDTKKVKENKNEKKDNESKNANNEKINGSKNKNEKNNKDEPLIKFDLILIYYTLYIYHQDSINEGYLSVPKKSNLLRIIGKFFIDCYF